MGHFFLFCLSNLLDKMNSPISLQNTLVYFYKKKFVFIFRKLCSQLII